MALAGGPIQIKPASFTALAKSARSERKPNPGWMACAPVSRAAAIIASALRYVSASVVPGR